MPNTAEIESKIRIFLDEINEILLLASKGLLKSDRLHNVKTKVEKELKELGKGLSEIDQLEIEKVIPTWTNSPKSNVFLDSNAVRVIQPLRDVLVSLLVKYGKPQSLPVPKNEVIVSAGKPFEGKQYLRSILNQARSSIFIRDNYLKPEIIDVLSEYIFDKPELKIHLIVLDGKDIVALRTYYSSFISQYKPSSNFEIKYLKKEQKDHPRYILIDEQKLFNPDHSLDQWGVSTVNVHEYTDQKEIQKAKEALNGEWESATNLNDVS